ncbi:hypothetical protein PO909_008494 [Leuciscus waleckii]
MCMDAALAPLKLRGMRVLNYLDDWLVLAQTRSELIEHRTMLLEHLENLGLKVNWAKKFTVSQSGNIFSGHRTGLAVYDSSAIATAHTGHSAHDGNLPLRCYSPAQKVSKDAGSHGLSIISTPAGSASHAPTAVLVKSVSAAPSVDLRSFSPQGQSEMHLSPETLESDRLVPVRCKPGDFLECEGGVHGRLHLGIGSAARGQTVLWPVVRTGKASTHKLLGNDSSRQRAEALLSPDSRTPRLGPFGQHVGGGLYKSPGRYQVPKPLQADGTPPGLGSAQFALVESSARARPPERGTRQTVQEQCSSRRMVLTPTDSPAAVGDIRQSGSRPVCVSRKRSLSEVFLQEHGRAGPHLAPLPALCFSPRRAPTPQVLERIRENGCSVLLVAPFWKNQAWFPVLMQLTSTAPWPIPSYWTRAGPHPRLVYVAAIAAFTKPTLGQSLGRNDLVIRFLRGAKRLNPPRPPSVPILDLSTVLEAMKGAPFKPIQSVDIKHLSFKTVFLLALASVKRIGDLQALSVSATCMEFGPNDSKVILKPRHGQTEQLFVSFYGRSKGLAVSKQSLSRWIVDAIALAYASKGLQCPLGVRAHSTRGMASSNDAILAPLPGLSVSPMMIMCYMGPRHLPLGLWYWILARTAFYTVFPIAIPAVLQSSLIVVGPLITVEFLRKPVVGKEVIPQAFSYGLSLLVPGRYRYSISGEKISHH